MTRTKPSGYALQPQIRVGEGGRRTYRQRFLLTGLPKIGDPLRVDLPDGVQVDLHVACKGPVGVPKQVDGGYEIEFEWEYPE